jgi:hypothetical protein
MFLKQHYGPTEGPLGFPMTDRAASALDALLRGLPKSDEFAYRKRIVEKAPAELLVGERADVSWITSEAPDRAREVVLARGMNDAQYQLNPIVTLQHAYHLPPVGRSLWRKVVPGGVKAKTHYPPRPASWPAADWPADAAFALVQAELLRGKSIGFLPTKVHPPTDDERRRPGWADVDLVIDDWALLEYACCYLPCQPEAVVESVSKSVAIPESFAAVLGLKSDPAIPFTPLEEFEQALARAIQRIDLSALTQKALERLSGRV